MKAPFLIRWLLRCVCAKGMRFLHVSAYGVDPIGCTCTVVCLRLSTYTVMAYSYGLYRYSLYRHGVYRYGVYRYGVYRYGVYRYGVYRYGVYRYGVYRYGLLRVSCVDGAECFQLLSYCSEKLSDPS